MKIYVAMSGGVDSSVAAALLKEQGYDVTGVTMRLLEEAPVERAEQAAKFIGIPHRNVDFRDRFKACVIDDYRHIYATGLTPNPCVVCNYEIKFGALLDYAIANGAEKLATGHYARIVTSERLLRRPSESPGLLAMTESHDSGSYKLFKGIDSKKDQSYFLYRLNQERLRRLMFPLGEMTKDEVRARARLFGLPQADQEESQDVCFSVDMASEPGEIIDLRGTVIGTHKGITGMTIGQRKGLGVAAGQPLYVLEIDAPNNRIVAGPRDEGYKNSIEVKDLSWIAGRPPGPYFATRARIRYNSPDAAAGVTLTGDSSAKIDFEEPQFAPAPGQSVVFYNSDELLGGGTISKI